MDYVKIIRFAQSLDESKDSVERLYIHLLSQFGLERPPEINIQRRGVLITFDGHSCAGKDTQIKMLAENLSKRDIRRELFSEYRVIQVIQKRQDPFRQVSKHLWAHPELEEEFNPSLLLLTCGRRYSIHHDVLPLLEEPEVVVIQNRSYLSNIAYHAKTIEDLPELLGLSDFDPQADLPFVLECYVDIAYQRIVSRSPEKGGVIYKNEQPEYIARVKRNLRGLAELVNGLIFIDTSGDKEKTAEKILTKVREHPQGKK